MTAAHEALRLTAYRQSLVDAARTALATAKRHFAAGDAPPLRFTKEPRT